MDAIDRYHVLAKTAAGLAVLLLIGAIVFRVVALISGLLVVLLIAAAIYFVASAARVRRTRHRQ